jgi:DNA polymerase-3 subunit delta'
VANASDGNYREALQLLQHADEDFHSLLKEWLNATLKNQPIIQVKVIEEIARLGREKQKQFLKHFTQQIEQAVRLQAADENMKTKILTGLSPAEQDFTGRLNKAMSLEQKEALAEELDKATYYIERNANAKILFHALTIKIFHIVKNNVVVSV